MAIQRTNSQAWKEAQQFCSDYNMFIVEKNEQYLLCRKYPRPTFIGKRGSVEGIRHLVEKAAGSKDTSRNAH